MSNRDYKHLLVWQKSIDLSLIIYQLTDKFPIRERYALTSQMRRAAISIPSNIAEGNKRAGYRDYRKFVQIALGSGAELETQRIIAERLGFISSQESHETSQKLEEVMKMLSGLEKSISVKLEQAQI